MGPRTQYRIAPLAWTPSRSSYRLVEAVSPFATYVWDNVEKVLMISQQYENATEREFEDIKHAILFASEHHANNLAKWLEPV